MMINKRLIGIVPESKRYIAGNVAFQWLGMASNAAMIFSFAWVLQGLLDNSLPTWGLPAAAGVVVLAAVVRWMCAVGAGRMSFRAAKAVKQVLRRRIYEKLLRLGPAYSQKCSTAEAVQLSTEGVEQLETYFGGYLPQFFYSMLAPVTLFLLLSPVSLKAAAALLVCVPLIPVAIAAVQTLAKRLLGKYWGQYAALGDTFLENLQGLTTLKIYQADQARHEEMNREAESFRRITMKVLTMQLNSITIMDLVAYGGAALGIALAVIELWTRKVGFAGCFAILLLSAEFFLPMRQLGSFFHVAMNGMAASDRIFALLDLPEESSGTVEEAPEGELRCRGLRFSYEADREVLHGLDMDFQPNSCTAIVGESGCGKSTVAAILSGRLRGYAGEVTLGGADLSTLSNEALTRAVTYVGFNSWIFRGTVRENLLMARPGASESQLWAALERANLSGFLRSEGGLDLVLESQGANLSGGQRQRLALARALLHDSPVYIFDEATSNIDPDSENDIMEQIILLSREKTVVLITHRLANVTAAQRIYVMDGGRLAGAGTHAALLSQGGHYAKLWESQQALEKIGMCEKEAEAV
ncbi:ABC transporter ATP-binding protein/permease [Pseudoflavonifractor sp.]|jgi:ABC-type transport system involved in cytochrome bd biosynthesis fused ATPase/permease subunit|uniref:ABC transporter ATP-binding protein/permease n=1 Tax=Pseudoflavonifractor sp. TaxID=1980281 RepID=UPI003D8CB166